MTIFRHSGMIPRCHGAPILIPLASADKEDRMHASVIPRLFILPILSWVLALAPAISQTTTSPPVAFTSSSLLPDAPLPSHAAQPAAPAGFVQLPRARPDRPRLHVLDWTMLGAAATLRVLDYQSTERGISRPQYLHEALLPTALVSNKPAFAAFEAGTVAVNYAAYRFLVRRHLRSLAQVSQYLYVGILSGAVAHNYQLLSRIPGN
jgi:hypothetical protein